MERVKFVCAFPSKRQLMIVTFRGPSQTKSRFGQENLLVFESRCISSWLHNISLETVTMAVQSIEKYDRTPKDTAQSALKTLLP